MASGQPSQDEDATTSEPDSAASLSMDYAQSRNRVSEDQRTISTVGAYTKKRKITDVLGQDSAEDTSSELVKRKRLLSATTSHQQYGLRVALDAGQAVRHGHSFSQVHTDGNARVHMGDRFGDGITINHNYYGLCAAMNLRLTQDIEPTEEAAILRLAAVIIVAAVANMIVQPFLLLRNALHLAARNAVQRRATPLSSLFDSRMVLFEDALGRFERIDVDVVTDWTSFHYNLTRAFADQPGHRRVAIAEYRLFDRAQGTHPIDPRRPPSFASVFMRNKHVRMSIHFAWDEVSLDCCPKCGLKQICELDKETTCKAKACGFNYRGYIKDLPIVELGDDDNDGVSQGGKSRLEDSTGHHANPQRQLPKKEQENPAWFSRISVSGQPEEVAVLKDSEARVDSYNSNMLANASITQLVDTEVHHPQSLLEHADRSLPLLPSPPPVPRSRHYYTLKRRERELRDSLDQLHAQAAHTRRSAQDFIRGASEEHDSDPWTETASVAQSRRPGLQIHRSRGADGDSDSSVNIDCTDEEYIEQAEMFAREMYYHELATPEGRARIFSNIPDADHLITPIDVGFQLIHDALNTKEGRERVANIGGDDAIHRMTRSMHQRNTGSWLRD